MGRRALLFTAAAALGAGAWFGARAFEASSGAVSIGSPAPDFKAAVISTDAGSPGNVKTIADYRGQVVLINLWATWCVPCVTEMPSIQRLYDRYKDRGFKVVGVAVDDPPFAQRVADWVKDHGITFEVLHEGSGKIEMDYRSRGIPATYVVGRDGRVRMIRQGAQDWDSEAIRAAVEQLLGTEHAATP